jgi:tetratricopeptide (TPR) repeat protein
MNRFRVIILSFLILALSSGCVYYNTFYIGRKEFNSAESKRRKAGPGASGKAYSGQYNKAIEKSQKILEKHPNSSWYDDALYVNGVSNYHIEDYTKAERRFRELVANYPDSKFTLESKLYLAKTKLKLGEEAEAMVLFEKLFTESKEKDIRIEAAVALGQYYFDKKNYGESEKYFTALIDSIGGEKEKIVAQMYIADGQFARFNYKSAIDNYLKILGFDPSLQEQYKATFKAGECSFFLHQIEDGMAYFNELAADPLFFDSLSAIKLMMAYGYELDGNVELAEEIYKQVVIENIRNYPALANYSLGLIYQYNYENYKKAKEHYDKAKSFGSGSGIYQEALQRSSDIGKLQEYSDRQELDTSATIADIDNAAKTQYLLAELYLTQLGKQDSALHEFQIVCRNFPESYLAPKALIAEAIVRRDYFDDTLGYDSTLRKVLQDYPHSDFIPEAVSLLGLSGTLADTGYASLYYHKAEQYAFDQHNLDSARYFFKYVADSFPRSSFNNQAKFAILWLTDTYENTGDSSLYYAYANFADSFPGTDYGKEASRILIVKPRLSRQTDEQAGIPTQEDTISPPVAAIDSADSSGRPLSPEERYYIDPDGKSIININQEPIRRDREFKFPTAAYTQNFTSDFFFIFQIRLDAFGDVEDYRLMNPSPSDELNQEAIEVLLGSHWDMQWIPPNLYNSYHLYKFKVQLPGSMR